MTKLKKNFIYTSDEETKNKLISLGYHLFKEDSNGMFVFENNLSSFNFEKQDGFKLAFSDTLIF